MEIMLKGGLELKTREFADRDRKRILKWGGSAGQDLSKEAVQCDRV